MNKIQLQNCSYIFKVRPNKQEQSSKAVLEKHK